MKYTAWKLGFNIVEVAIIPTNNKGQSKMNGGIFKEAIFGVLSLRIKSLFKKYKRLAA